LEAEPATGNNRNQGKCLGTKPGALQAAQNDHGTLWGEHDLTYSLH